MDKPTRKMIDEVSEDIANKVIDKILSDLKAQAQEVADIRQKLDKSDDQLTDTVNKLHDMNVSYEKLKEYGLEGRVKSQNSEE